MVGVETAVEEARCWIHLHNKSQVPVPPLLGAPRLVEKKEGRGAVRQHREADHSVAVAQEVVVRVQQPLSVPTTGGKDYDAKADEAGHHTLHEKCSKNKRPLKPENPLQWPTQDQTRIKNLTYEGQNKGQGHEGLYTPQPVRGQPIPEYPEILGDYPVATSKGLVVL